MIKWFKTNISIILRFKYIYDVDLFYIDFLLFLEINPVLRFILFPRFIFLKICVRSCIYTYSIYFIYLYTENFVNFPTPPYPTPDLTPRIGGQWGGVIPLRVKRPICRRNRIAGGDAVVWRESAL